MFITKLTLHKCRRFYLKGIETIDINPTAKTPIVLGTNGSGKSSLLKLGFTVVAPEAKDFLKGGYKLLHCLHKGNEYQIRNDFAGKSPLHSFKFNDEELNEGGTGAVQRELVREHFGVTQDLHMVLTGQLRFTDMSAIQRREWITLLSSADFDYVIKLHKKIKTEARNHGVVVKHVSGRLVTETGKKVDDATVTILRKQAQEITEKLIQLHQNSKTDELEDDFETYRTHYHQLMGTVEELLTRAKLLRQEAPPELEGMDSQELIDQRQHYRSRIQMLEEALGEASDQYQEIDNKLHQLDQLSGIDPVELEKEIAELEEQKQQLQAQYKTRADVTRLPTHEYCIGIVNQVMELLHGVGTIDNEYTDRNKINEKQNELSEAQSRLMAGTGRISELEYRLNHIRNCSSVTCPKCSHHFKEGIGEEEETSLQTELNKGYKFKQTMDERISTIREWLSTAKAAGDTLYQLQQLHDNNPELIELWKLIAETGGFGQGRVLMPLCSWFVGDINTRIKYLKLEHKQIPLIQKLESVHKSSDQSGLRQYAATLAEKVVNIKTSLMEAKEQQKVVSDYLQRCVESNEILKAVGDGKQRLNELMDEMVRFLAVDEVRSQVRQHQSKLGALETSLAEAEIQMGVIKDLTSSLEEARVAEKALVALEQLLSPKDGLIAEQIKVFINTFIDSINEIIARVWGYNLALDTCDIADGDLDYKFPMYVHNSDNRISDIQFGSDSQVDIINQAFRLIVYKFLNLEGYPLYLDELGRTFDEVHRLNLTLALKDLMLDETFSQVFFISHSYESQNSYPNSQVVVIDDSHLQMTRSYNEHVTIT